MALYIPYLIDAMRKFPAGREACKHNIAVKAKERTGKPIALTYTASDVELKREHCISLCAKDQKPYTTLGTGREWM